MTNDICLQKSKNDHYFLFEYINDHSNDHKMTNDPITKKLMISVKRENSNVYDRTMTLGTIRMRFRVHTSDRSMPNHSTTSVPY
jgi:hypothetical protein